MSKRGNKGKTRHPPAEEVSKDQLNQDSLCQFCHQGETKDILQSGRLYKMVQVKNSAEEYYHYFCLLFSSHGVQRGKDEEGLNGFLSEDIKKEVKRGENIKCDICGEGSATIQCQRKTCNMNYHFTCGATSNPEHVFVFRNNMESFCPEHAPRQNRLGRLVVKDNTCMVCLDKSFQTPGPGPGRLVSPCCGRTFHRDCVQKTALQAGKAALKCPACNDKDKFNDEIERCGIYVPHADAQWEMPENSTFYQFEDMLNMYRRCDAVDCSCPRGRDSSKPGSEYEVINCETCGQSGVHIACGGLEASNPVFVCTACQPEVDTEEDSEMDSEEEDEMVRETLLRHEEKRLKLIAEKNRLIKEEQARLSDTKKMQEQMIQQIKDIFSSSYEDEKDAVSVSSNIGARVQIVNQTGGQVKVGPTPPVIFGPPSRTAMFMPRKHNVALDNSEKDLTNDSDSDIEIMEEVTTKKVRILHSRMGEVLKDQEEESK